MRMEIIHEIVNLPPLPWTSEDYMMYHDEQHVCSCGEVFPDHPTWASHLEE